MPYLNWKESQPLLRQEVAPLPSARAHDERMGLTLSMGADQSQVLLSSLKEVLGAGAPAGELRLDLPQNWIVFWKVREGEGRLLIAHPEQSEWVTTVALSAEVGLALLARLESWRAGDSIVLSQLGQLGSVSNAEVTLIHL